MARTLAEIDADISKFQTALDDLLLGTRLRGVKKGERDVQYDTNVAETKRGLEKRLFELRHERACVSGDRSPAAPIRPGMQL